MSSTFDVIVHDTTVYRLTLRATDALDALAAMASIITTEPDWRSDAELEPDGQVRIVRVEPSANESNHP